MPAITRSSTTNRARFESGLAGEPIKQPVYAVYDWFVNNRPAVDWQYLFDHGLGQIQHAVIVKVDFPHLRVEETRSQQDGRVRRDVRWITDRGELHEWYLGEWRQEHFIKSPQDYRIMTRALSDAKVSPTLEEYEKLERVVGDNGITLGTTAMRRTAFQKVQVELVGIEQFSLDIAQELPELLELLDVINDLSLREFQAIAITPVRNLKLWENLSIETMGPSLYRKHLAPIYRKMLDIIRPAGQKLCVHYDGHLDVVKHEIAALGFDGIDSFTEPPEGDMTVAAARQAWPDKFLWLHPNLGWYQCPGSGLENRIKRVCREAGTRRFCLMVSEDIPPDWRNTVPRVLDALR